MGDTGTGATPGSGAMPAQPASTTITATSTTPAAGATPDPAPASSDDQLGAAGLRALQAERQAREAAERQARDVQAELEQLRAAGQSETERALAEAKRQGSDEATQKWQGAARRAAVDGALRAAGVTNDKLRAAIATGSDFTELEVGEDGTLPKLTAAVEQARNDYPEAFAAAGAIAPVPPVSQGAGAPTTTEPRTPEDRLRHAYATSSTTGRRT